MHSYPHDPTQETHTPPSREFLNKIIPFIEKAGLSYTEEELIFGWLIKIPCPESDAYLELFVSDSGATVEGMYNKKTELKAEAITPKNFYALTPEYFKACLTILDFHLS